MQIFEIYVLIGLLAAGCIGGGRVLEKRGLDKAPHFTSNFLIKDGEIQWSNLKKVVKKLLNTYFLLGVGLDLIGWLLTLKALTMGNLSIVQPLKSFGNLVAVILGVLWLRESLDTEEYLGVGCIIIGIIVIHSAV